MDVKSIDLIAKNKVVFLESIKMMGVDYGSEDYDWYTIMNQFIQEYNEMLFEYFDMIYGFSLYTEDNVVNKNISLKMNEAFVNYLTLCENDNRYIIKLYDEIGDENINKISQLVDLFCEYFYDIDDLYQMNAMIKERDYGRRN